MKGHQEKTKDENFPPKYDSGGQLRSTPSFLRNFPLERCYRDCKAVRGVSLPTKVLNGIFRDYERLEETRGLANKVLRHSQDSLARVFFALERTVRFSEFNFIHYE